MPDAWFGTRGACLDQRPVGAPVGEKPAAEVLLACLGSCAALLSGYAMSKRPAHSPLHMLVFAVAIAATVYVVLDLEFPRFGFIRVDPVDQAMEELRGLMAK